jgi:hypothetical protein
VVNVDHHAAVPDMNRHVSSTNLAIERLRKLGPEDPGSVVVISHTDCDSVLSSGIISGELPPDPLFGDAAVAADHTGVPNDIADLLQGIDQVRDIRYCLDTLRHFLYHGEPGLDERASADLAARRRRREVAADAVERGEIFLEDGLAFGCPSEKLDGEFFCGLLPGALAILLMTPRKDDPSSWDAKIRLGAAAPEGASLHQLGRDFDPAFAGRWNAGSNARNKGTQIDPQVYARALKSRLHLLKPFHANEASRSS